MFFRFYPFNSTRVRASEVSVTRGRVHPRVDGVQGRSRVLGPSEIKKMGDSALIKHM